MIRAVWLHLINIFSKNTARIFFSLALLVCGMFMMSLLFLAQKNAKILGQTWTSKIEVIAYLSRELSASETESLEADLKSREEVDSFDFKASSENQASFKELFPDLSKSKADEAIIASALPATYEIKLKQPLKAEELSQFLGTKDFVSSASFGKGIASEIIQAVELLRGLSVGTIAIFSLFGFALLQLAIFMSVFSKKHEIEIFNLLGTPKIFIKMPFAIEGMLMCFSASILGVLMTHFVFTAGINWLESQSLGVNLLSQFQSFSTVDAFSIVATASILGYILGHQSTQFLLKENR